MWRKRRASCKTMAMHAFSIVVFLVVSRFIKTAANLKWPAFTQLRIITPRANPSVEYNFFSKHPPLFALSLTHSLTQCTFCLLSRFCAAAAALARNSAAAAAWCRLADRLPACAARFYLYRLGSNVTIIHESSVLWGGPTHPALPNGHTERKFTCSAQWVSQREKERRYFISFLSTRWECGVAALIVCDIKEGRVERDCNKNGNNNDALCVGARSGDFWELLYINLLKFLLKRGERLWIDRNSWCDRETWIYLWCVYACRLF